MVCVYDFQVSGVGWPLFSLVIDLQCLVLWSGPRLLDLSPMAQTPADALCVELLALCCSCPEHMLAVQLSLTLGMCREKHMR